MPSYVNQAYFVSTHQTQLEETWRNETNHIWKLALDLVRPSLNFEPP
jgi:hypothetical protein